MRISMYDARQCHPAACLPATIAARPVAKRIRYFTRLRKRRSNDLPMTMGRPRMNTEIRDPERSLVLIRPARQNADSTLLTWIAPDQVAEILEACHLRIERGRVE